MSDFDITDVFKEKIEPLLNEVMGLCDENGIPICYSLLIRRQGNRESRATGGINNIQERHDRIVDIIKNVIFAQRDGKNIAMLIGLSPEQLLEIMKQLDHEDASARIF